MKGEKYRWVMLGLIWLCGLVQGMLIYTPRMMGNVIADEFGLAPEGIMIAAWKNLSLLVIAICLIVAGILTDKYGVKIMAGIGCALMGIFGVLRAFSSNYAMLMLTTALLSVGCAIIYTCVPKTPVVWFSSDKLATTSGLAFSGLMVGGMLGCVMPVSLFQNNWEGCKSCFLVTGIIAIAVMVIWLIFAKEKRVEAKKGERLELSSIMRCRNPWLFLVALCLGYSAFYTLFTLGEDYFEPEGSAGMVMALCMLGYSVGLVLIGVVSDKIRTRKPIIMGLSLLSFVCFLSIARETGWITGAITSFFLGLGVGGMLPVGLALLAETKEIGPKRMASVSGIGLCFATLAGFLIPTYVSTYIYKQQGYGLVWLFCGVLMLGVLPCGLALKEKRRRSRSNAKSPSLR